MADKFYTIIDSVKIDKVFDDKYKKTLPDVVRKAAKDGIKDSSSGLTETKPKDAKTYSLTITVSSLTCKADVLDLVVKIAVSEEDNLAGSPTGHSSIPSKNPKERDDDVEALVTGVVKDTIVKRVREIIVGFIAKNR